MSSTINSCKFDPEGNKNPSNPINPISAVQKGGANDISTLIQEIVTKDFKYTGSANFKLTLRSHKMVLRKADGTEIKTLRADSDRTWASAETAHRLTQVLERIGNAYLIHPGRDDKGKDEATAEVGGALNNLQNSIGDLTRAVNALERKIETAQIPRDSGMESARERLEAQVVALQETTQALRGENDALKGLREPLEKIAHDVPQEMREINFNLAQIRLLLERFANNQRPEVLDEVKSEMTNIRKELSSLNEFGKGLEQENERLREENDALKAQLALKDRQIEELSTQLQQNAYAYEAMTKRYLDQERYLIEARADNDSLRDELVRMEARAERASELEEENQYLLSGALLAKKRVEEDAARIHSMGAEIDALKSSQGLLERENSRLNEQLDEARKAQLIAQRELKEGQEARERAEKKLEQEKKAAETQRRSAEQAKQRINALEVELLSEKDRSKEQDQEAQRKIRSLDDQLRGNTELFSKYEALQQAQEQEIIDQLAEIERLRSQMEEQKRRGLSDTLLQTQLAEKTRQLEEEVNARRAVEAQIATLKRVNQVLEEQVKPRKVDLVKAPEVPQASDVVQEAVQLVQALKEMKEETIPEGRIGAVIGNRALLEGVEVKKLQDWIQANYSEQMSKELVVRNQIKTQPNGSPLKQMTQPVIKGNIAKANTDFAIFMEKIKTLPKPLTLGAIFGMENAFIAQALLKYERTVEPLLDKCTIQGAEIEKGKQLLETVRSLKAALLEKLKLVTL